MSRRQIWCDICSRRYSAGIICRRLDTNNVSCWLFSTIATPTLCNTFDKIRPVCGLSLLLFNALSKENPRQIFEVSSSLVPGRFWQRKAAHLLHSGKSRIVKKSDVGEVKRIPKSLQGVGEGKLKKLTSVTKAKASWKVFFHDDCRMKLCETNMVLQVKYRKSLL